MGGGIALVPGRIFHRTVTLWLGAGVGGVQSLRGPKMFVVWEWGADLSCRLSGFPSKGLCLRGSPSRILPARGHVGRMLGVGLA